VTLLKGALISFTPTFLVPVPNVTIFQYNPETLTHNWSQPDVAASSATPGTEAGNPYSVPGMPGEDFSLTIVMDSNQDIADSVPVSGQLADVTGLYTRLAALEMLLYPVDGGAMSQLLGQTSAALGLGGGNGTQATATTPSSTVPIVLFAWGAFRIVPVRITGLTITEKLYDTLLNPVHAEVALKLRVLTPSELAAATADNQTLSSLATVAYTYTLGVRQVDALLNLGNAAVSLAGIL
jgi:hypothetical protein